MLLLTHKQTETGQAAEGGRGRGGHCKRKKKYCQSIPGIPHTINKVPPPSPSSFCNSRLVLWIIYALNWFFVYCSQQLINYKLPPFYPSQKTRRRRRRKDSVKVHQNGSHNKQRHRAAHKAAAGDGDRDGGSGACNDDSDSDEGDHHWHSSLLPHLHIVLLLLLLRHWLQHSEQHLLHTAGRTDLHATRHVAQVNSSSSSISSCTVSHSVCPGGSHSHSILLLCNGLQHATTCGRCRWGGNAEVWASQALAMVHIADLGHWGKLTNSLCFNSTRSLFQFHAFPTV